jgi:hypothetical protein
MCVFSRLALDKQGFMEKMGACDLVKEEKLDV